MASIDDALRVFYGGSASEKALVPTLKHPRQKNISCVKWRPLSASGLAVAAQDGIVLWKVCVRVCVIADCVCVIGDCVSFVTVCLCHW